MLRILILFVLMSVQVFASTGSAKANIKLRSQATMESESIGTVSKGSSFEILGEEGEFFRVNFGGQEGFLATQYVKVKKPTWEEASLLVKISRILTGLYLLFGLIVGEMMIRSYMMRFFNSLTFIHIGTGKIGDGPVFMFLDFLEKKIIWEGFLAIVATAIGCTLGWIYLIIRVLKSRTPRAHKEEYSRKAEVEESGQLSNWPPKAVSGAD